MDIGEHLVIGVLVRHDVGMGHKREHVRVITLLLDMVEDTVMVEQLNAEVAEEQQVISIVKTSLEKLISQNYLITKRF